MSVCHRGVDLLELPVHGHCYALGLLVRTIGPSLGISVAVRNNRCPLRSLRPLGLRWLRPDATPTLKQFDRHGGLSTLFVLPESSLTLPPRLLEEHESLAPGPELPRPTALRPGLHLHFHPLSSPPHHRMRHLSSAAQRISGWKKNKKAERGRGQLCVTWPEGGGGVGIQWRP